MRVASGASSCATIARTRSKSTGDALAAGRFALLVVPPLAATALGEVDADRHGVAEGAGYGRPTHGVRHQLIERLAVGVAFDMGLDAHGGEADRLLADVADAPHRGDVDVAFEFEFDAAQGDAAINGVGVDADRDAR